MAPKSRKSQTMPKMQTIHKKEGKMRDKTKKYSSITEAGLEVIDKVRAEGQFTSFIMIPSFMISLGLTLLSDSIIRFLDLKLEKIDYTKFPITKK